jgi:cytochrome c biogenesis protein CcmG/thiol:disulfide interchange protein DsbE
MVRTYEVERDVKMAVGDTTTVNGYTFTFRGTREVPGPNYTATRGLIEVSHNGKRLRDMRPEKRIYRVQNNPMTEAAIATGFTRDLYVSLGEPVGGGEWIVRVYVKPFVDWIWGGCLLMALGGVIAATDRPLPVAPPCRGARHGVGGSRRHEEAEVSYPPGGLPGPGGLSAGGTRLESAGGAVAADWQTGTRIDLPRLDDPAQRVRTQDLLGKVWMLNVWASWCAACRDEHPLLVEMARRKIVPIYGLDYKDSRAAGLQTLSRFGDPYVVSLFDADGRVGIDWGVYGVPETFIIDKAGVIRMKHIGPLTPDVVRDKIEPLVRQLNG